MPCVNTSNPVVAVKNALFVIKVSGSTIAISGTSDFEMIVNFRSLLESNIMENCDTSEPDPAVVGTITNGGNGALILDRKSTRLNSSHVSISYAVFCLKK